MPVTFDVDPSKRPSSPLIASGVATAKDYISLACSSQAQKCQELLQASFGESVQLTRARGDKSGDGSEIGNLGEMVSIRRGGFVDVATEAYNKHYHLVIRPDDIWISILSQLSFYVNAHAEELRSTFVAHEGKKELVVKAIGTRYTIDFGYMSRCMGSLLRENVKDPKLCDWIQAEFSTTTLVDRTIYAIEMMATLKEYFSYHFFLECGLPRVTLEGSQADWEDLLRRVDTLKMFGEEPTKWAGMLCAVLKRFVRSFEVFSTEETASNAEEWEELKMFWRQIASYRGGSGPTWLSGWITAFCPFNCDGEWIDKRCAPGAPPPPPPSGSKIRRSSFPLVLDGEMFPIVDSMKVPSGSLEVDVKLDDNGEEFDTLLVAGHLGGRVIKPDASGDGSDEQSPKLGLAPGWFMFIKDKGKVEEGNKA